MAHAAARHRVPPLQGWNGIGLPVPRALPWAAPSQPFGLRTPGADARPHQPHLSSSFVALIILPVAGFGMLRTSTTPASARMSEMMLAVRVS